MSYWCRNCAEFHVKNTRIKHPTPQNPTSPSIHKVASTQRREKIIFWVILRYNDFIMKHTLLLLALIISTAQASLEATYRNNLLINPDTNQPFTGNLDVINNDWGKDAVEFNKDYVDGILHGTEKVFYRTGQLKSVAKYINGKVEGAAEFYYDDGTLKARIYIENGVNNGRGVSYYPNGFKSSEGFYFKGELQGLSRTWYEDGTLMTRGYYSHGKKDGLFTTYYEDGEVFEEMMYDHDTLEYKKVYRENGTLADRKGWLDNKIIERIAR